MLLESILSQFDDAIAEDSHHRIKNIFYYLKAKGTSVQITYAGLVYQGTVAQINYDFVRVIVPEFRASQERKAVLNFEALNRYYMCHVFISKSNPDGLFIDIPKELRYLERRLYKRIHFEDLFIRFIILYSPILETKQAEQSMEARYPHFLSEILKDQPSLRIIYKMLVAELTQISAQFDVKMIYHDMENLSLLERTLLQEGKCVLIEDTARMETYIEPIESARITNLHSHYAQLCEDLGEFDALLEMEKLKKQDARNFLVSYLLIPITLFEKCIGYFRLETNQFEKRWITLAQTEELALVAELFSYAITKIRIRNSHFDPSSKRTRVLNISQSGLLMEINDETLYTYLQKHRRIKMLIPIRNEELEIYGEIIRYFPRDGAYYFGVLFFKSAPDAMIKLENFIRAKLFADGPV